MYLCRLKLRHSIYMTTLDIILLVLIGTGAVLGFAKGFLRQLAGLLGLIVGLLAAKALYATVADEVFSQVTDDAGLARGLAFVAIWLLVPLLFLLVASLLTRAMEAVSLGWLNRLLGAALGAAKYALCISLLLMTVDHFDTKETLISRSQKEASILYGPMTGWAELFIPAARKAAEPYIFET